jgi:uncharacterized GH25 family protein
MDQIVAGRTGSDGRWLGKIPTDVGNWSIYALKASAGFDYACAARPDGSKEPWHALPERLTLTLDGARPPLRVKAVDPAGKPLAGVLVGPWLLQKPGREVQMNGMIDAFVKTGDDGVASLEWLPARIEGQISIVTESPDYYTLRTSAWIPADPPVDELAIVHLPYERLSGRVTTKDGRPAANAQVRLEGAGAGDASFRALVRTDADGRFRLKVYSEQAYIITATKGDMAAPYRSSVVVRAGKPVEGIAMVLGRGTYLRGRVTVGADEKAVADTRVRAFIDKGSIPAELTREGDRIYHPMTIQLRTKTDPEGRFEFLLGPGDYTIRGPARVEPIKVTIPAENPPRALVHNLVMPRPETGPFTLAVVDAEGKPIAGADVDGAYQSMDPPRRFDAARSSAEGLVRLERSLDPLVIEAATPDRTRAGIVRVDATATEAKVVVKSTATASGRVVDTGGKPLAGRELEYGIIVHKGPSSRSPFSYEFGGTVTTDERGKFALAGLVVGETYQVRTIYIEVKPNAAGPLNLGDFKLDPDPPAPKPCVPLSVRMPGHPE